MTEQQPDHQRLKSIKLDLEKKYLQLEATDATALRLHLTPQGVLWEVLHASSLVTARSIEASAEGQAPEGVKERSQLQVLTGRIKGQVREGKPDASGKRTAWARLAAHMEGEELAKMLSTTFHRGSTQRALTLRDEDLITAEGYHRPASDPTRMDGFSVFRIVDWPGKEKTES